MSGLDYVALASYLTLVLGLGWVFRTRSRTHAEFFLAGRSMGWLPIGLSVMVTAFSAINFVAMPNEVFGYGLYVTAALPVFFLVAWPITKIWMPFFHAMGLTSAYAYLERRFDWRVRTLASGLFILWRLFWMATALYAAGKAMGAVAGLPAPAVIVVGGAVATVYTFVGGMRAVMWTDVLQFVVLFGGVTLGVMLAAEGRGFAEIFALAREGGRLRPFAPFDPQFFSLDPTLRMTFWSGLIGVFTAFLARYGSDQVVMQRYFTARSLAAAQRGMWLNAFAAVASLALLVVFGLAVWARAVDIGAVDPAAWAVLPPVRRKAAAMGQLAAMIRSFPPGVTGLIASGLLAATMSSIDSGINACSAAYVTDVHKRLFPSTAAAARPVRFDRRLTLALGLLSTALALALIPLVGRTQSLFVIVNKVINGLGGPLLALFVLGMFSRRVNAPGMLIGGVVGLAAGMVVIFGVAPLALQYYAVAVLAVTVIPCVLFSELARLRGCRSSEEQLRWLWRPRMRA